MRGPLAGLGLVVLVVVALAGGWWLGKQSRARTTAEIQRLERSMDGLTAQRDSLLGELARGRGATDSLIDTLWLPSKLRVDTLTDSVPVPVEVVREIVRNADTTIRACRATLTLCEREAAVERLRADSLAKLAGLWKRQATGPRVQFEAAGFVASGGVYGLGTVNLRVLGALRVFAGYEQRFDASGAHRTLLGARVTF